ncbi:MAG: hypothetical protein AB7T22_00215 [Calditrichaceae bacterium]
MKYLSIIIYLLVTVILTGCSDRDKDNIFDPGSGITNIDLNLFVSTADSTVQIRWRPPQTVDFTGYKLYKKTEFENQFTLLSSFLKNQTSYQDTDIEYDIKYSYYLTLIGENSDSPPTNIVEVMAGPGDIWLIDRWGLETFLNLAYDLKTVNLIVYGVWIPEALAFDHDHNRAMATYPTINSFDIFDLENGEVLFSEFGIENPFDCLYDRFNQSFWLTDSSGKLYEINPVTGTAALVATNLGNPIQIELSEEKLLFILDDRNHQILVYNLEGVLQYSLSALENQTLMDPEFFQIDQANQILFLTDQTPVEDILYKYDLASGEAEEIYRSDNLGKFRIDEKNQTIWIIIFNDINSEIMQLSYNGLRLSQRIGFISPSDLRINPKNGNLIVSDTGTRLVKHFRSDSTLIGVFSNAIYPFKVFIE